MTANESKTAASESEQEVTIDTLTLHRCTTLTQSPPITFQVSSFFNLKEAERFDKDFAQSEARVRAGQFDHEQNKHANLRQERYEREAQRFENMDRTEQLDQERLQTKVENFNAGKKNQGGAAYNLLNLDYEQTNQG